MPGRSHGTQQTVLAWYGPFRYLQTILQFQYLLCRFNTDPSVDLLLLTTKVGGLGLNLTGADTVIFVEHDWNPTVDIQVRRRTVDFAA